MNPTIQKFLNRQDLEGFKLFTLTRYFNWAKNLEEEALNGKGFERQSW